MKDPDTSSSPAFFRGGVSGVLVVAVLQPFDVVKTVQQANNFGALDAIRLVIKQSGPKGLWLRGLGPTLVRGAAGPGIYFQVIELTNHWFEKSKLWDFAQGALARATGAVIISPFSVLKARKEWDPKAKIKFSSFRDMFVGLTPTLARDVPFSGLFVIFYRTFKTMMNSSQNTSIFSQFGIDLTGGLLAGALATAITHPFDVMKTRSQIGRSNFHGGIWSGLLLRLAKRPLSTALTWAFYEAVSKRI